MHGVVGGRKHRSVNLIRGESTWIRDNLAEDCFYPECLFRRRFGVARALFHRLHEDLLISKPLYWGREKWLEEGVAFFRR